MFLNKFIYFKLLFAVELVLTTIFFIETKNALSQTEPNQASANKQTVSFTNEVSERLVPVKNETMTFPSTAFIFGIYKEFLSDTTSNDYSPTGYGMILGFEQKIKGMWNGGVEARWSDWNSKNSTADLGVANKNTSPLSIFSKVTASPELSNSFFGNDVTFLLHPFLTGGIGYTIFFDDRAWLASRSKSAFGQVAITYGGGVRFNIKPSFGFKISYENWRGVQTSSYEAQAFMFQVTFGDLANL